ncbi:MAG: HD domain-containing protein [Desulfarculus sp.]|nr:HD domain-containing protein [Desulfarculus sp.]
MAGNDPGVYRTHLLDQDLSPQRRKVEFDPAQFGMAAISIEVLHPGEESPADFFLPLYNPEKKCVEMSPACTQGEVFKTAWRERLLAANLTTVYVPLDQAGSVTTYFCHLAEQLMRDSSRPMREKRQVVREVACLNLRSLFASDLSSRSLRQSLDQTKELVTVLGSEPQLLQGLGELLRSDVDIFNHCVNVCMIAMAFGRFLDLTRDTVLQLGTAGMLHDLGYSATPNSILRKPDRLSAEEWRVVRQHPTKGYRLLMAVATVSYEVLSAVQHHHENWNGSGYPAGLNGERIPRLARVLRVVDAFDAMTSQRSHRRACTAFDAASQIMAEAGTLFDPRLAAGFVRFLAENFVASN